MATKSFIEEGEVGSQGRRQWRVHLAFEELDDPSTKIIPREEGRMLCLPPTI